MARAIAPKETQEMSSQATPIAVGTIVGQLKGGVLSNFSELVEELSADGIGLGETEAEDFGTLIDNFTQNLEGGDSVATAWSNAWAPFASTEKSQLWQAAIGALQQVVSVVDNVVKDFEAVI
jgi:hypothetical protein